MTNTVSAHGGGQCEDRARLICCLCQIAGLPARFVASYTRFVPEAGYAQRGGYVIVEIYIEGGWCFFDSLDDFYCLRTGYLRELQLCDPALLPVCLEVPLEVRQSGSELEKFLQAMLKTHPHLDAALIFSTNLAIKTPAWKPVPGLYWPARRRRL